MLTEAITAPTPITIPSIVSNVRILFRRSARRAIRRVLKTLILSRPHLTAETRKSAEKTTGPAGFPRSTRLRGLVFTSLQLVAAVASSFAPSAPPGV